MNKKEIKKTTARKFDFSCVHCDVFFIICIIIFMAICNFDAQDELIEQKDYCQNVKAKLWPDFKHIYAAECGQYEKSVDAVK